MSNLRISVKEVKQFYEQVQRQTATVTESIDLVEKRVDELLHMDQFQGEAADTAKEYFQVLHKNLLQAFRGLYEQIEINISRHLQDFHEEVDSSHHAIIHQTYLDEKETDIHQSSKRIQQIETDISQIISSISDLSSARAPTAANVLDDSEASLQVMKQLSQRMEAYSNGFKSDQSQIESAMQEISSLMGKVINNTGRTQLETNFETQLPGIRSYVKASMETSAMQRILSPLHNKIEENTIISSYNWTREHTLGLQQYMNNPLIDKQGSQYIQHYMNLRLNRTIQQANTWWSQTLMYQTSKAKWQLGYLSLFNRQDKRSQAQNKMDKLQAEDIATVKMSDEEAATIQNYLKEIESGEVKPNKDWNVSQFKYPELTFEDKRKVLGGMGTGTPDGLAGPSTTTFKFFTEDIATIIDPNAGMGDKAMASLFTFVKPAKFLDTMGDVAGPGLRKFGKDGKDIDNAKDITKLTVDDIPTAKSGNFNKFFNSLTSSELDELWKDKKIRKKIERQLREPGGLHEWHLVSRAPQFKYWNIGAEEIKDLRTAISDVKFVNPRGVHGGLGSTKAHNELLEIIDTSSDYNTFVRRLNNWANYRLEGGVSSLPQGLRLK
ncbi:T7SS effector LXG polymorphic toxin [Gracilibacillus suaedae]|uniref:T7SS effector LXG polymorphic toxin n=1 Tax=Gracilibacillus suaedae TaxID=2820273 RepID=UPI001ABE817D|nr:T7SS effector LXG polymorphic toxin [Gracilibacillus suaedae]